MALFTHSKWYYGFTVNANNRFINIDEGSGEIAGQLRVGGYTLTRFVERLSAALNTAGTQDYTVTVDRVTRIITISAPNNFSLPVTTGTNASQSVWALAGFTSDKTGSNTYESDVPAGREYVTQVKLQGYVDFEDNQEAVESSVNESSSGVVEAVNFGIKKIMECRIELVTNITPQGYIRPDPQGVDKLRDFLVYATTKAPLEFIPDETNPSLFTPCILETTKEGKEGTSFKLKELFNTRLIGYFETGRLQFRQIEG